MAAKASASCGAVRSWPPTDSTTSRNAPSSDRRGCGLAGPRGFGASGPQNGRRFRLLARLSDMEFISMRTPLMPSSSEWCILMYSAKRPPCSPSIRCSSHGGRLMSSGWLCRRAINWPSSRSPPGCGSASWRRWNSRSTVSSSTQVGSRWPRPIGRSRRFHGGMNSRCARMSAISDFRNSGGSSSGSENIRSPAMCIGVSRDSTCTQEASSGLRECTFTSGSGNSAGIQCNPRRWPVGCRRGAVPRPRVVLRSAAGRPAA